MNKLIIAACAAMVGSLAACGGSSSSSSVTLPSEKSILNIPNVTDSIDIALNSSCSSVKGARLNTSVSPVPVACQVNSWLAGSTQLCQGRHIYRDFVYDDNNDNYPVGQENTADLVNLQLWTQDDRLYVRGELNTLFTPNSTTLAIAIDTDNDLTTGGGDWCDINISSSGWEVLQTFRQGDIGSNIIEGSIPLPAGESWRVQAVTAQENGTVMNVAYRSTDFNDSQSATLKDEYHAEIKVADLVTGITVKAAAIEPGLRSRVYTSDYTLPPGEGLGAIAGRGDGANVPLAAQVFVNLGKYQPYALYFPDSGTAPYPLQMVFHGSGFIHGSQIDQPGMQQAFGEQFGRLLVSPLARGPDGYGSDISERDLLDVMQDVEENFDIDLERVISSGYSQGGYISFRMAALYPQRFAGFIAWVGFTGDGFNGLPEGQGLSGTAGAVGNIRDFVGNLRSIPGSMIYAAEDQLVQVTSAQNMRQAFDATDNIYKWYMHPIAEHLTFILLDQWDKEADDSAYFQREASPVRVTFRHDPAIASPKYGIAHNQAYWISSIKNREVGVDHLAQVYGDIDLINYACGGDLAIGDDANDAGPWPLPWVSFERNETGRMNVPVNNLLEGTLKNISALTIDVNQTCNKGKLLRYSITTDGPATMNFSDGRSIILSSAGVYSGSI
jgi:pimeloyl-ACP methyl ester carboxylesterase